MRTAIVAVWLIGLLGALPPTLVILKESFLVIRTLRQILQLARMTAVAAHGVANNTIAVSALEGVGATLQPVDASMPLLLTMVSVLAVWAFLTTLVVGLVLIFKPLEAVRGHVQRILAGVRA